MRLLFLQKVASLVFELRVHGAVFRFHHAQDALAQIHRKRGHKLAPDFGHE